MSIRQLTNGSQASFRRFVWCDNELCEERDAAGAVTKRFFEQGMKVETGPTAGNYFYTRDHLGSIRELTDSSGNVRARYAYDPYGRRTKLTGDLEADFGFAGMFMAAEAGLATTLFRAYDPELGRWLSRDPLSNAETDEGPNLYAYVHGNPVNMMDPLGLKECCTTERNETERLKQFYQQECSLAAKCLYEISLARIGKWSKESAIRTCGKDGASPTGGYSTALTERLCREERLEWEKAYVRYLRCAEKGCKEGPVCKPPNPNRCKSYNFQGGSAGYTQFCVRE